MDMDADNSAFNLQEEDIYQVPAMDVDGLYSQLKTVSLPRNSVRYRLISVKFQILFPRPESGDSPYLYLSSLHPSHLA